METNVLIIIDLSQENIMKCPLLGGHLSPTPICSYFPATQQFKKDIYSSKLNHYLLFLQCQVPMTSAAS